MADDLDPGPDPMPAVDWGGVARRNSRSVIP
jgi:hypothetical protein